MSEAQGPTTDETIFLPGQSQCRSVERQDERNAIRTISNS